MSLLDERDLDWIAELLDIVERAQGRPWRVAFDLLDAMPVSRRRMTAVRSALLYLCGGKARVSAIARRVRETVLGAPALDANEREARVAAAAAALGVDAGEIASLLFCDLRGERPIAFANGRPPELEVAAFGNIQLIQRAIRKAYRVRLRLWEDDGALVRAALARGLLTIAERESDGATCLEIAGPHALFKQTAVYGRALAELVPQLSSTAKFELQIDSKEWHSVVTSPALLPISPLDKRSTNRSIKLALAIERAAKADGVEMSATVSPPPLLSEHTIAFPDLAIEYEGERWYLELVGFWTADFLHRKLGTYTTARVFLCVDPERVVSNELVLVDHSPKGQIVQYSREVLPEKIVQAIRSAR